MSKQLIKATQEDFNLFLSTHKENIYYALMGVKDQAGAKLLKKNWAVYANLNGFESNLDHLKQISIETLENEDSKKNKRKSKY